MWLVPMPSCVPQVAPALLQALQQLLPLRRHMSGPSQLSAMLDRSVLKLVKALAKLMSSHPWWAPVAPCQTLAGSHRTEECKQQHQHMLTFASQATRLSSITCLPQGCTSRPVLMPTDDMQVSV